MSPGNGRFGISTSVWKFASPLGTKLRLRFTQDPQKALSKANRPESPPIRSNRRPPWFYLAAGRRERERFVSPILSPVVRGSSRK